jgi:uncharacterized protein YbbC (DUF1343 family)
MKHLLLFALFLISVGSVSGQSVSKKKTETSLPIILPGAERMDEYLSMLKGKSIGLFANQTSLVGGTALVDTLVKRGVHIEKIFAPEHGFRGIADAGENVGNVADKKTGIKIISLYGSRQKPTAEDLKDIDLLVFDIQDVGVRFYTYISSLQLLMEAAFENNKPLLVLDRPNPNGFYVDGPVLDKRFKSFVGMQPIPIVYGMTIGEYAMMIAGEGWLSPQANEQYNQTKVGTNALHSPPLLRVIPCANYDHRSKYILPVRPSPNLPDMQSVYLYPSTCFFEGTVISLGRGTAKPFEQFGSPLFPDSLYSFTPRSIEGAKNPPLLNQICYGYDLSKIDVPKELDNQIQMKWLIQAYHLYPDKAHFFLSSHYIHNLAGTDMLSRQIEEGKSASDIRESWQPAIQEFKKIRKKYLIYKDFE